MCSYNTHRHHIRAYSEDVNNFKFIDHLICIAVQLSDFCHIALSTAQMIRSAEPKVVYSSLYRRHKRKLFDIIISQLTHASCPRLGTVGLTVHRWRTRKIIQFTARLWAASTGTIIFSIYRIVLTVSSSVERFPVKRRKHTTSNTRKKKKRFAEWIMRRSDANMLNKFIERGRDKSIYCWFEK